MTEVSFCESNRVKAEHAIQDLLKAGYGIAFSGSRVHGSWSEIANSTPENLSVGILRSSPRGPIRFLWFTFARRGQCIGTFHFSNKSMGANNRNWVLEVFGRENLPALKNLAASIARTYKRHIHIRLESEEPKEEMCNMDYMP
jgi:hypothetical protein